MVKNKNRNGNGLVNRMAKKGLAFGAVVVLVVVMASNYLDINHNGTFYLMQEGESSSGTWTIEGNTIIDPDGMRWIKLKYFGLKEILCTHLLPYLKEPFSG